MKNVLYKLMLTAASLLLAAMIPCLMPASVFAQQEDGPQPPAGEMRQDADGGGDPIRRLNLTPDQVRQIRQIRVQNREQMQQARRRLDEAQRALDEAIYADTVDDALVEARASEFAQAQAATVRMRARTELNIRRVLTLEQLNILRELRRQARLERRNQRQDERDEPPPQRDAGRRPNIGRPRDNIPRQGIAPRNNPNNGRPVGPRR